MVSVLKIIIHGTALSIIYLKVRFFARQLKYRKLGYDRLTPQITKLMQTVPFYVGTLLYAGYTYELLFNKLSIDILLSISILSIYVSTVYLKESEALLGEASIIINNNKIPLETIKAVEKMKGKSLASQYRITTSGGIHEVLVSRNVEKKFQEYISYKAE